MQRTGGDRISKSLKDLGDKRDALLLAEIGCWVHMLGKFHEDFLGGDHDLDVEIVKRMEPQYQKLKDLLTGYPQSPTWMANIWNRLQGLQIDNDTSIASLIKNHKERRNPPADNLIRLLIDAHGRGSGIEKGILERFFPSQQNKIYLSTAFGFEKDWIDLNTIASNRGIFYGKLENYLDELKKSNAIPSKGWLTFRKDFIKFMTGYFTQTVGDTRHPVNDVTLFDQTVSTVAFFKCSLAQVLLTQYSDPLILNGPKYHWRFLRIGIDGSTFWIKSLKIPDIRARQALISDALDQVRDFVEVEYPLGYEIYRDENGSVFVFPDIGDILDYVVPPGKLNYLNYEIKNNETLRMVLKGIFRMCVTEESEISIEITDKTRNMLLFGEKIDNPIPELTTYSQQLQGEWSSAEGQEMCIVCGLRPQDTEEKVRARKTCEICECRRSGRSEEWTKNLDRTIWIDEISDVNGRIALIVGKFLLKDWLKGNSLNSMVAFDPIGRQLSDPEREQQIGNKKVNKQYNFDYSTLICEIRNALTGGQTLGSGFPLLDNLLLKYHRGGQGKFRDIYDFYMNDSDLCSLKDREWRFALLMLRQQPSPPRIRRIWETTRQFWQDILPTDGDVLQSKAGEIVGKRGPRLLLIKRGIAPLRKDIAPLGNNTLGSYHAYELILRGTKMSVVWDSNRQEFITADNLAYIAKLMGNTPEINKKDKNYEKQMSNWAAHKIKETIKGTLEIEEPVGYGARDKKWGSITVTEVTDVEGSEYIPAIPILAEPSTFMALVPADRAIEVVKAIKEKHEREMGKVKNRLPLTIGIIFAHQYTPLRVIIDAGQRMLANPPDNRQLWKITEKLQCDSTSKDSHFAKTICIQLENENDKIRWNIPLCMGDGKTDDHWYPYAFLKDYGKNQNPEIRKRSLKAPCPQNDDQLTWLVHAEDLCEGDTIYFTPSSFDFEWLDTSGRRFEIAYENGIRLGEKEIKRPYLLENIEILDNIWNTLRETLTTTQIHALKDIIEQKRKEWNITKEDHGRGSVFWQFCRDALITAQWRTNPWENKDKKSWLDEWADYAARGWLTDVVEIYMQIMKERSEIGGS